MAMGLADRFDPTRNWEEVLGPAPDPTAFLQLPTMPFGSPLESARVLGKPDAFECRSRREKDCFLIYAKKGLRLRFRGDRLIEVSYLVGQGAIEHPAFVPSQPRAPDGTRLTPEIDRARIISTFGEPDPGGSDDTCLQVFHGGGVISDFYLDQRGHLREWNLYPDD
jgi:hypothetical protein